MAKILITESQFMLLTEGQTDRVIKKHIEKGVPDCMKPYLSTLVSELPDNYQEALSASAPTIYSNCVEHKSNLSQFYRLYFLSFFDIDTRKPDPGPYEYVRGIARIAIEELGMLRSTNTQGELGKFKQIVMFMHRNKELLTSDYNSDLNSLNYRSLANEVDSIRREFNKRNRENAQHFQNNKDYKVVRIDSFKDASKYGRYTSWCITHEQSHFDSYTPCGERFYFCLRNGFEKVKEESTAGCPLDNYGLSMVSIRVDMDGEPLTITTRWNHDFDGENNERLCTREQVESVLGIDFYGTFKPYTKEELRAKGLVIPSEVPELLASGVDPREIFSSIEECSGISYREVSINSNKLWNYLKEDNTLLLPEQWFEYTDDFYEGFARVGINYKCSFIDTNGNLIRNGTMWFDWADSFNSDGYSYVHLNDQDQYLTKDVKLFPNKEEALEHLRRLSESIYLRNVIRESVSKILNR